MTGSGASERRIAERSARRFLPRLQLATWLRLGRESVAASPPPPADLVSDCGLSSARLARVCPRHAPAALPGLP